MKLTLRIKNILKKVLKKRKQSSKTNLNPRTDKKVSRNHQDNDYVSEDEIDQVSSDSISLYTCEMPEQKLASMRTKNLVYKCLSQSDYVEEDGIENVLGLKYKKFDEAENNESKHVIFSFPEDSDYINMEEPNYDDYMCYSDSSSGGSTLLRPYRRRIASEALPPYSKEDPLLKH